MSTSDRPLRHAIVGVGAAVLGMHRSAFGLPTTQIVGVTDVNHAAAETRAEEFGCPAFPDAVTTIEQTRPDVVVIMTPHPFHADIAVRALEAGCHVLCEKPMAVHAGEADRMIAAAERTGQLLAVSLQFRHRPEVVAAKRLIDEGRLGQLQRVDVVACWTRAERYYRQTPWRGTWKGEGGGVLMNQAPHNLDLACYLAGPPSRVVAWTRTRLQPIQAEDTAHAMLAWESGALGTVHVSTAEADLGDRIEILGTGGRLTIRPGSLEAETFERDVRLHIRETEILWSSPPAHPLPVSLPPGEADHAAVYRDLHSAILHGTPLAADGRQGRLSLELANAITLSARRDIPVPLPLDRAAYLTLLHELRSGGG
ncbi:MAG: Gfo/Idh/MocA family oxidoreductase [Chloroflexi bacterium]|nr:Gfo/Idh/MocA family oxidoreductase [Chloroflexota bacterium]